MISLKRLPKFILASVLRSYILVNSILVSLYISIHTLLLPSIKSYFFRKGAMETISVSFLTIASELKLADLFK